MHDILVMPEDQKRDDITIPEGKRTGRERPDPTNEPAEFADDMRVNRFTPPPDPEETPERDDE